MAGKRGRGKKAESVAVEAADSTSEAQQNGTTNETEMNKPIAQSAKGKGTKGKKETVEQAPVASTKKSGRGKKTETSTENEKVETETQNEEPLKEVKKGKSKKEVNGDPQEEKNTEVPINAVAKKSRGKKTAETATTKEEMQNAAKEETAASTTKKTGRKRAAETPSAENGVSEEAENVDMKKQKKERETKSKEKESSKTPTKTAAKSGRGKKEVKTVPQIEEQQDDEPVVSSTPIAPEKSTSGKGGRGKKRGKTEEPTVNEGVEEIAHSEEIKATEPVAKKEKKTKTTAKSDSKDTTSKRKTSKTATSATEKKPKVNQTNTEYDPKDFEFDKEFTLKISSWNVAGLRSWISKGGLKYIEYEKPDIFCLQETKCSEDMIPEEARIQGYHPYWYCKPGGYAGVAMYSKKMPINIEYGIGDDEQDADARIMTAEYEKFYLINVYVPNAGRKLVTLPKRMRWDEIFHNYVFKLNQKKPVIICGDMNVSHLEIDLANPKANKKNAGFTQEERDGMTKLLSLGFVDTYRFLYPDNTKAYTFWTYMMNARAKNVGWRLDYFIVAEKLCKKVVENAIRSKVMGSDHCPITLFLNI